MTQNNINLSTIVVSQLPEFVQADHPAFVEFIQAYYEYLETQKYDIANIRDIDTTLDVFINHLKQELNFNGWYTPGVDDRYVLSKIKEVYSAKGSEASYRLLFRLLFKKEIDITYPYQSVLRASSGAWQQDVSLFVSINSGNINDIINKNIKLTFNNKSIFVYVKNITVSQTSNNIYEVAIDNKFRGLINAGAIVSYNNFNGTILNTIGGYEVSSPGKNFKVGQIFEVKNNKFRISKITLTGGIKELQFIKFNYIIGSNFAQVFQASTTLKILSDTITITKKDSSNVVTGGIPLPTENSITKLTDAGVVSKNDYWYDYSEPGYVGTIVSEFNNDTISVNNVGIDEIAVISFKVNPLAKYQGYYQDNQGFLSDNIKIQDNSYYQPFSYVISIDEQLESYKNIVKTYLHPAGTRLFANYNIDSSFKLNIGLKTNLNNDIGNSIITDNVNTSDSFSYQLSKNISVSDSVIISENISAIATFQKSITDSISITDTAFRTFDGIRGITDSTNITDMLNITFNGNRGLTDTVNISDNISILVNRNISIDQSDSIEVSDTDAIVEDSFDKVLFDDLTVTDNDLTYKLDYGISLSDSVSLTDNITKNLDYNLLVNDSIAISDGQANVVGSNISIIRDNVNIADDQFTITYNKQVSDSVITTDSISSIVYEIKLNDSIVINDFAPYVSYQINLNDSAVLTDTTPTNTNSYQRVASDSVTLVDSMTNSTNKSVTLTDSAAVSDTALKVDYVIGFMDSVTITDANPSISRSILLTDSVTASDSNTTITSAYQSSVNDSIVVDDIIGQVANDERTTVNDSINISDNIILNVNYNKSLSDNNSINDSAIMMTDSPYVYDSTNPYCDPTYAYDRTTSTSI